MENKNSIKKNIVLIGMPASGKSTVGKLLSKKINYEYYDAEICIPLINMNIRNTLIYFTANSK